MHAYLVMVHKNINQVKKLLELLDYYDNDIYIHVDRKAKKEIVECDFSINVLGYLYRASLEISVADFL